ncbi:MAG: GTPase ObgE, partial [Deltaproteobacteria bacterium]
MKFIDTAKIYLKAGDGGKGCISFRREKFVPRGGPNGGNGGKGGSIIIRASRTHRTLLDLRFRQHHSAPKGEHGQGSDKTGHSGDDIVILVPIGTLIKDIETEEILADLTEDKQDVIVARGGIGGKGNAFFSSSTNQAPRYAQDGIPGDERWVTLELKLLADVGIIGMPNVGKSTFISRVSAAKPKIADYPFTTLIPNLGVVYVEQDESFVVADIPGLIEGAHSGAGMGTKFLRHIERTSILLHILDISDGDENFAERNFAIINNELRLHQIDLINKQQIVAINKIDLPVARERVGKTVDIFRKKQIEVFPFSAVTGEGVKAIISAIAIKLR